MQTRQYIIGIMRSFRASPAIWLTVLLCATSCSGRGLVRQFEYQEENYLDIDGAATVTVSASIPALVALRGLPLDPRPNARVDQAAVRRLYECPVARVAHVSRPWRRKGRRFIQIRVETDDIRRLSQCQPFSWSTYRLEARDGLLVYMQRVGAPTGSATTSNWDGSEMVAFRMHLPSRILYHDSPSREVERGNILTWDQRVTDRMAGRPIAIEVRMDRQSILHWTLAVFAVAVSAALLLLALIVWWVRRKGHAAREVGG